MKLAAVQFKRQNPFQEGRLAGRGVGAERIRAHNQDALQSPLWRKTLGSLSRPALSRWILDRLQKPPDFKTFPELQVLHPERVEWIQGFADGASVPESESALYAYARFCQEIDLLHRQLQPPAPAPDPGGFCSAVILTGPEGILGAHNADSLPNGPLPRKTDAGSRHPMFRVQVRQRPAPPPLTLLRPRTGYVERWGLTSEKGVLILPGLSCNTWLDEPIEDTWPVQQVPLLRFAESAQQVGELWTRYHLHNFRAGTCLILDRAGGAIAIEKTFRRIALRKPDPQGVLCATDGHFESPRMNAYRFKKTAEWVARAGTGSGSIDMQYLADCHARYTRLCELAQGADPTVKALSRIMSDHAPFPRNICRHATIPDGYDQTVTLQQWMVDLTHLDSYHRAWIPGRKYCCQQPWIRSAVPDICVEHTNRGRRGKRPQLIA